VFVWCRVRWFPNNLWSLHFGWNYNYYSFGELTLFLKPKRIIEMKYFFCLEWNMTWRGKIIKHELAKPQAWGCPRIPVFFQVMWGFQFPTHIFNFSTIIIVYILETASLFLSFCFFGYSFSFSYKNKNIKKNSSLIGFFFLLLIALSRITKTTKRFAFFFAFSCFLFCSFLVLSWFPLSFCF
jgi:hypothetical protein